jgi:hypothetical protein
MKPQRVPYDQVPQALFIEIVEAIGDYSVALARITGDDPATFQILGSGTCVKRGSLRGILTAHHVLHAHRPPVRLGTAGPDRIIFLAKGGRVPGAMQHELVERPLGVPKGAGDYGPDLTFIPLPANSSLRGTCAFWDLDQPPEKILRTFALDRACIVTAGYPQFRHDTKITGRAIHANVTLQGGAGALMSGDIVRSKGWDFINCECDYGAFPHLPDSYAGISGGGIWSALLGGTIGELKLRRLGLVGVNFWETKIKNRKRMIRGHFVRSIYGRAWAR